MPTKKKASTQKRTPKKDSPDELIDVEGLVKCILWTQRFVTIADELRSNGLPYADIKWVATIAACAFPEEHSVVSTSAIGFETSSSDYLDMEDDEYE